jgi:hypothetical protein
MHHFQYKVKEFFAEEVPVREVVAKVGSPA